MTGMGTELLRAARRLVRAPVFALVSIATVAVGIGAFASIYSVVDTVLLEPPAYADPNRLVWVWRDYWFGLHRGWLGGPDIAMLREHDDAFEGVVAFRTGGRNLTGREGENPERVRTMAASADFLDVLGVRPAPGRGFAPGEDAPDASGVAVLGWDLWQSHFGGDPGVVGREIYLDGEAITVVGVAPKDFHFVKHASLGPPEGADLYVPLRMDLASLDAGSGMFAGLARVREGVPAERVKAAIDAVAADLDATALFHHRGLKMWGIGLQEDLVASVRPTLVTLLAGALFLLLVLGANLTTLLLGRAGRRERELAVRAALGAGRSRLLQSAAAESVLLCALGGALGMGLAYLGVDAIRAFAPEQLPRRWSLGVDLSVLGVATLATLAMGAVAGLVPALGSIRGVTAERLREGGRGGSGLRASRTRSGLVVAQLALSLTLLVGAGLLTRAFVRLLDADPGFDGRAVLTTTVSLDPAHYPTDADVAAFDRRFRAAVSALPGVRAVGAVDALPLSAQASQAGVSFPGAPGNTGDAEEDGPLADYMMVTPGYVEAVGMRVLDGRSFDERDDTEAPAVALVDDLLARRFFPGSSAVGRRLVAGGDTLTVIGVVDQARHYSVGADDRPQMYVPLAQNAVAELHYAVAGTGDPLAYPSDVRHVLDTLDPAAPMSETSTLAAIVGDSLARERLSLVLLVGFAGGALLLATLGLYGVVSNAVAARSRELGVRIAVGADRGVVLRLILRQGLRLAGWGALIGLLGALASARALGRLMPGIEPNDPVVYAGVTLLLAAVTGMAAWIPASRATHIDPIEALRSD
jgi:putative ABC transport system permease protein